MENNKNKKSVKFQGDMLNFCDFIQVFVFTRNHHLNETLTNDVVSFEQLGPGIYERNRLLKTPSKIHTQTVIIDISRLCKLDY